MPYETTTGKTRSDGRRRIDPMFNSAFIRTGYDSGYGTGFGKGSEEERRAIASRLRALGVSEDVIEQAVSETGAAESSQNK